MLNVSNLADAELDTIIALDLLEKSGIDYDGSHLSFLRSCWMKRSEPLIVGYHTREICAAIDQAIDDYDGGRSSSLLIQVPVRHGKSDMVSRYLPPHFVGRYPDAEVMAISHKLPLAEGFSRFARSVVGSSNYQTIFPDVQLSSESKAAGRWGIDGRQGGVQVGSLTAGIAGMGYHCGVLDDYHGSRADAESTTIRDRTWDAFTSDFLTRRAPVSITIVCATPWTVDDIAARIIKRQKEDAAFPRFKLLKFPAKSPEYPSGYLFPERFNAKYYEEQFSALGPYAAAGLLQCDPTIRGGNMLKIDGLTYHETVAEYPESLRYYRVWDLAHTEKQRTGADPDWTSGTLLAYNLADGKIHLWVKDVVRVREGATKRDALIRDTAMRDGPTVQQAIEESIDANDAVEALIGILSGIRSVVPIRPKGDKVIRATPLEPVFEGGNVHLPSGARWLDDWLNEIASFPLGAHDDQVDNLTAGYILSHSWVQGYAREMSKTQARPATAGLRGRKF